MSSVDPFTGVSSQPRASKTARTTLTAEQAQALAAEKALAARRAAAADGAPPPRRIYADRVEELMCHLGWDAEFMPEDWAKDSSSSSSSSGKQQPPQQLEEWRKLARLYLREARARGAVVRRDAGEVPDEKYMGADLDGAKANIERLMYPDGDRHPPGNNSSGAPSRVGGGSDGSTRHGGTATSYLTAEQAAAAQISRVTLLEERVVAGEADRHTEYVLQVEVTRRAGAGHNFVPSYVVRKRFRQFHGLADDMARASRSHAPTRAALAQQQIGRVVDKKRWSKLSAQNRAARKEKLTAWLAACSAAPGAGSVLNTPVLTSFFGLAFWHATERRRARALADELAARQTGGADEHRRAMATRLLRFLLAVRRRNSQIARVQNYMRDKLKRFALLLNHGLEVLKFPSQPSCNPRVRVLWLHPDGLLCLGRELAAGSSASASSAAELAFGQAAGGRGGGPLAGQDTEKRPGKAIRLESLTRLTEGALSQNFEQSPRFVAELQAKPENAQCCLSIYGNPDAGDPSFHIRLPSLAARAMLVRKLLDLMSEMAAARPLGADAARAQACSFARTGTFLPKTMLQAISAATSRGAVAGRCPSLPCQVEPPVPRQQASSPPAAQRSSAARQGARPGGTISYEEDDWAAIEEDEDETKGGAYI